jgi:hypothetical protein
MWIQSRSGAFSLVLADDRDTMLIRARLRKHLELLQGEHPKLTDHPIVETSEGDYRWQIGAPPSLVAAIVAKLVLGIDYDNFKDACSKRDDLCSDYLTAVSQVWGVLRRMQDSAR